MVALRKFLYGKNLQKEQNLQKSFKYWNILCTHTAIAFSFLCSSFLSRTTVSASPSLKPWRKYYFDFGNRCTSRKRFVDSSCKGKCVFSNLSLCWFPGSTCRMSDLWMPSILLLATIVTSAQKWKKTMYTKTDFKFIDKVESQTNNWRKKFSSCSFYMDFFSKTNIFTNLYAKLFRK